MTGWGWLGVGGIAVAGSLAAACVWACTRSSGPPVAPVDPGLAPTQGAVAAAQADVGQVVTSVGSVLADAGSVLSSWIPTKLNSSSGA